MPRFSATRFTRLKSLRRFSTRCGGVQLEININPLSNCFMVVFIVRGKWWYYISRSVKWRAMEDLNPRLRLRRPKGYPYYPNRPASYRNGYEYITLSLSNKQCYYLSGRYECSEIVESNIQPNSRKLRDLTGKACLLRGYFRSQFHEMAWTCFMPRKRKTL